MGCDNDGHMTRRYGLEDTDVLGDTDVYNAKDSVIFCNVRDCFNDRLTSMFQQMESKDAWKASRILREMKAYQAIRPERLWIIDMRRKYIRPYEELNDNLYIPRMNGTKELQRAQFQLYQEDYCASKYASAYSKENRILFRANKQPDAIDESGAITVQVTMYQDCYLVLDYDGVIRKVRVQRGVPTTMSYTVSKLNDTPVYIYTGHKVQAIGDVSDLRIGSCDLVNASKLQELVISPYDTTYTNTNFKEAILTNCSLLKKLIICGCPDWKSGLNLNGCPRLETLDVRNTGVTVVQFAADGYLQSAKLPESVTSLTAKRLTYFSDLSMAGYDALQVLNIEYCPALDTLTLVNNSPNLSRVRLIDIDWSMQTANTISRLASLAGIDDNGTDVADSVVTGTVHVDTIAPTRYNTLTLRFPNLTIIFDIAAAEYLVQFFNDNGTLLNYQMVEHGAAAEDPRWLAVNPISTPTKESTEYYVFTFAGWDKAFASIMQPTDVYATYTSQLRTYKVRWMSGSSVLEEDVVTAGGSCTYDGPVPSVLGSIWTGFDKEATNVLSDIDIKATWTQTSMPSEVADPDTYEFVYSDDPTDSSAYTIEEFVGIITSGNVTKYFPEAAKIKILNSGSALPDETIELILTSTGHFRLEDQSALANTTWISVGLLNKRIEMYPYKNGASTNVGGYLGSNVDAFLESDFWPSLPYHWRSIIKPVIVLANAGGQTQTIKSEVRHLYIPSIAEMDINRNVTPYDKEIDSGANEIAFSTTNSQLQRTKKLANGTGDPQWYWTRSASYDDSQKFRMVSNSGGTSSTLSASSPYYICLLMSI